MLAELAGCVTGESRVGRQWVAVGSWVGCGWVADGLQVGRWWVMGRSRMSRGWVAGPAGARTRRRRNKIKNSGRHHSPSHHTPREFHDAVRVPPLTLIIPTEMVEEL